MEKNRVKNGLERGQKWVLNGQKNGISPNSTIWNGVERPFFAVPHLSCRFLAIPPRFSPVFHDFGQKREKNGCPKMEERERKERVPFPFLSRSHFFPILAWHISSTNTMPTIPASMATPTRHHQISHTLFPTRISFTFTSHLHNMKCSFMLLHILCSANVEVH